MEKRIILAKASAVGPMGRGQSGKKKVYEILVTGRMVTFSWGMAEKTQRQTCTIASATEQGAVALAWQKKWAKMDRGYSVVLEA